jgi:hypothetical protein
MSGLVTAYFVAEHGEPDHAVAALAVDLVREPAERGRQLVAQDQRVDQPLELRRDVGVVVARRDGLGERGQLVDQVGRHRRRIGRHRPSVSLS